MIIETIKGFKLYFESNSDCFSPTCIYNSVFPQQKHLLKKDLTDC